LSTDGDPGEKRACGSFRQKKKASRTASRPE
jgi:hypothetical protein